MASMLNIPQWFLIAEFWLELTFAIITLLVGVYAYKTYKLSGRREPKLFAYGFSLISLAYFIQFFFSIMIITKINEDICDQLRIQNILYLNMGTIIFQVILFSIGLATLVYMTFKKPNRKLFTLLILTVLVAIIFSAHKLLTFHLLSTLFLAYIVFYYADHLYKKNNKKVKLIFIAFVLLLLSSLDFLLAGFHDALFVAGHILELGAYILILVNLIHILRK